MKKIIVMLFLICGAFGEWQKTDEIVLPKNIQVNDLTITNDGEVWVLSASSILKIDPSLKDLILIQEITDGKLLVTAGEMIYFVKNNNRFLMLNLEKENIIQEAELVLNTPRQINAVSADDKSIVIVLELNRLAFIAEGKIIGAVTTDAEKFTVIPLADYNNSETPIFTLANNRVFSWTDGSYKNSEDYRSRLLYSSSGNILDFAADKDGDLYILFSDSVVVLLSNGEYKSKILIDNLPVDSKILINPANNNLLLFNRLEKTLQILSETKKESSDIIILNKNRPNPVDNFTEIDFTINQPLNLTLTVYNLIGEPVKVIARDYFSQGTHRVTWDACDEKGSLVPNGVYFYRLESNKGIAIKQLIVLR